VISYSLPDFFGQAGLLFIPYSPFYLNSFQIKRVINPFSIENVLILIKNQKQIIHL